MPVKEIQGYSECFVDHICQKMGFEKGISGFMGTAIFTSSKKNQYPKSVVLDNAKCVYKLDGTAEAHYDFKHISKPNSNFDMNYWILLCGPIKGLMV